MSSPARFATFSVSLSLKFLAVLFFLVPPIAAADERFSGSWYDPGRNGEGFHIEVLEDDLAMVVWFTYPGVSDDSRAEQAWVLGVGSVSGNVISIEDAARVRGPVFGPNYDKDDREITTWGDLTFEFSGLDRATVSYDGADGSGEIELQTLTTLPATTSGAGLPVGFSGSWYNPETDGQGWFIEVLTAESALVYWFTYDENGNQAWNLGVGFIDENRIVLPGALRGTGTDFGEAFDAEDVSLDPVLELVLEFDDCDGGEARYRTLEGELEGRLPVVRLTRLLGKPCDVTSVKASEGGYVEFDGGRPDCLEGRTCLVDRSSNAGAGQQVTAVARNGFEFLGWKGDLPEGCDRGAATCALGADTTANASTLIPEFAPDGSMYYPASGQLLSCAYVQPTFTLSLRCDIKAFEDYGYGPLSDFTLSTDRFFIDYEARKEELAELTEARRRELCMDEFRFDEAFFQSYVPTPPADPLNDPYAQPPGVFEPLVSARIAYELLDIEEAGLMIKRALLVWAEHDVNLDWDASLSAEGFGGEMHYQMGLWLPVYVMAWDVIRDADFVSASERVQIDDYLHRLKNFLAQSIPWDAGELFEVPYVCDDFCAWGANEAFNHAWSQDLGLMVFGVMTGNNSLYQQGIRRYFRVLDGLVRPDGSHFYESQRGGSGLNYSIGATDTLIRIAELAAMQGHDLYSVEVNGMSLHKIIEFHVAAIADETLIHPYSETVVQMPELCEDDSCVNSWNSQFFSETNPGGWDPDGGWIEFDVYRQRFPDRPVVQQYLEMFPEENFLNYVEGPFRQVCEFRDLGSLIEAQ